MLLEYIALLNAGKDKELTEPPLVPHKSCLSFVFNPPFLRGIGRDAISLNLVIIALFRVLWHERVLLLITAVVIVLPLACIPRLRLLGVRISACEIYIPLSYFVRLLLALIAP